MATDDIPQWYFWTLLALSLTTVPVLVYNYIMHHRERKKNMDIELDKRTEFKSRGNISGKRQMFTLVRDPFNRSIDQQSVACDTPSNLRIHNLVGVLWEKEKTVEINETQTDPDAGTSGDNGNPNKWKVQQLLKVKMYEAS
ncbi:hypothetical protein LSH36_372g02016 [Paralvinella palmiformis]|uniref:Uncharacterized protein n=1 Tax=Paralvinella palmiformis TaxID=53620 RepID=A0AAD9N0R6_9ANNE|nr:hypothetical protein LSH36_372g02016 [Paralvinella palmiformis]